MDRVNANVINVLVVTVEDAFLPGVGVWCGVFGYLRHRTKVVLSAAFARGTVRQALKRRAKGTVPVRNRAESRCDGGQQGRERKLARARERILIAAARAFARSGYRATTMQDIAREARYSAPSLYAYFAGKDEIFTALGALLQREFQAVFRAPMPVDLALPERLELLLRRLFAVADQHQEAVTMFACLRFGREEPLADALTSPGGAHSSGVQLFTEWLHDNAKRGELGEHDTETLGVALASLAHGFCLQWLRTEPRIALREPAATIVRSFLYGAMGG